MVATFEIAPPLFELLLQRGTFLQLHRVKGIDDPGDAVLYLGPLRQLGGFVDDHVAVSNMGLERLHVKHPSLSRVDLHPSSDIGRPGSRWCSNPSEHHLEHHLPVTRRVAPERRVT